MDPAETSFSTDVELVPAGASSAPHATRPRIWTVFAAVVAGVVLATVIQVIFIAALAIVEMARGGDAEEVPNEIVARMVEPWMFMAMAGGGQLGFAICAIAAAWLSPYPFRQRLGLVRPRVSSTAITLTVVGSWAPLAVGLGFAHMLAWYVPPDPMVEKLLANITQSQVIPFVIFIAIVPGVVEELLFRGYAQGRLLERWSPWVAITVTSLLFALVHVQPHHVVAVFPIGLWLGVVAWKSGSVIPSILCHAFINGSLNAWRMIAKFNEIPEGTQHVVDISGLFVGAICFVLAVNFLFAIDESQSEHRFSVDG
jgi:membrane protease YdiL (CAAX protease family)